MSMKITIGSRGSDLALWQAEHVKALLADIDIEARIEVIKTQGDKIQNIGFDKMEGKGFFTKEIEAALLDGSVDLAVHSHKDLETVNPEGLCIAAVPEREKASELLLIRKDHVDPAQLFGLKKGSIVGTSSARRKNQLTLFRPDVEIQDLRGNVPTRINKLREGNYDAILLAKAGVTRLELDLSDLRVEELDTRYFVPAPAQGALALQVRESDVELRERLGELNGKAVAMVELERSILRSFQGGCQVPLGVHAKEVESEIHIWVSAARQWDSTPRRVFLKGIDAETMSERALALLGSNKTSSVFISRDLSEESIFNRILTQNNVEVVGKSLIETQQIPFDTIPDLDRIFFASKNGVQHFFEQYDGAAIVKADAIGHGTASALRAKNVEVDFIGDGPDTSLIGKQYAQYIGSDRVLFVTAESGSRKVQHALQEFQREELMVYRTVPSQSIGSLDTDVLVFTSPSNASAYFSNNALKSGQQVVAIGTTTREALSDLGITNVEIPWASHELALADAVLSLPNGNEQ